LIDGETVVSPLFVPDIYCFKCISDLSLGTSVVYRLRKWVVQFTFLAFTSTQTDSKAMKKTLLKMLLNAITADLKKIQAAAQAAIEGATHEENRAEGNKDMRSTEASYLARGQAMRVEELTESVNRLHQMPFQTFDESTPVSAGALVCLENTSGQQLWYWVVTDGAGYELVYDDMVITTITPRSPLGRELVERFLDDEIDLFIGGRHEHFEIVEVI